jgi:hypothetical protein
VARSAERLAAAVVDGEVVAAVAQRLDEAETDVARVLSVLAERFDDVASGAARELDRRAELDPFVADAVGGFVSVPWMDDDVHGLDDLVALARHLGPQA